MIGVEDSMERKKWLIWSGILRRKFGKNNAKKERRKKDTWDIQRRNGRIHTKQQEGRMIWMGTFL